MILILRVFLRLLNSFEIIFRQETSIICTTAEVTEANSKCFFLLFIGRKVFAYSAGDQESYLFIAEAQNEQGVLLFVYWKLA